MKLNIDKAKCLVKKGIKVDGHTQVMMPEFDDPQDAAKVLFEVDITEDSKVLNFVGDEMMSHVREAIDDVAEEESERSGFRVAALRNFKTEPVQFTLFDGNGEAQVVNILNARIHGKPLFVKPEGEGDGHLTLKIFGNITFAELNQLIVYIGADAFCSMSAAQIDMFKAQADQVDEKMAASPMRFEKAATEAIKAGVKTGEITDENAVRGAARDYAQRRIDEGHSSKKVLLEDVKNAMDFVRVPDAEGLALV